MRKCKDIFTVIFTATLVVLACCVAGLFSLVFSFNVNTTTDSITELAPQGTWHDDTTKNISMNIYHDKYDNPHGTDNFIIGWQGRTKPEGDNKSMADPAMKNLSSVKLTVEQGNKALKFKIKRKKCDNNENDSWGAGQVEGVDVGSGVILVYINGERIATISKNLRDPSAYLDFEVSTSNYNIKWNTTYEVGLILAFEYYNWYHHDVWYYKGMATTTVRFNDTVAPTGTLKDGNYNTLSNGCETNKDVCFGWDDAWATAKLDGNNYSKNTYVREEGNHTIVLTDQVGLSNTYTFKIDKTAPVSNFDYSLYGGKRYTANDIVYAPTDSLSNVVSRAVKFGSSGEWAYNQSDATRLGYNVQFSNDRIIVPTGEENNGEWYFQATDSSGNTSKAECVVLMKLSFGNQRVIRDAYKQNTWFDVTLPLNIYGEQAGVYSVANYETALAFAISKEWEFRVSIVADGFMYVSSANGNLTQLYTERETLDSVVYKYANSYISERKVAKNGKNNFTNILNDNLVLDETALTQQNLAARYFMPLDLPVYFLNANFKFENPGFAVETFVKMQMIGDDTQAVTRDEVMIDYGVTVGTQIFAAGNNTQGYYLVTEWDTAGNKEQYYVYVDVSAPKLEAEAIYGNGDTGTVCFDEELVADYAGTFRYLSLNLSTISDFIDEYTTIKITGRKFDDVYFVQGDELPILDGVEYYGNYTIELYDRSGNTLQFIVSVAGEQPYMSTTSLTSETSCRLTLNVNDRTNTITELKLFRILYDGTYVEMAQDHKDVTVEPSMLQYTLTSGGKFTLWYKDLYGRTVECAPIFYMKGLPTATLSGVIEGGITNRNVTLRFNDSDKLILYKVENGVRTEVPENVFFSCVLDETTHRVTASLTANEETTGSYVFFLHKADEISLFVEYAFSIDCIIAPIYIVNENGIEVIKDSFTNKPFYIYWSEAVTLRYYTDTTPGGELGAERYTMGKSLTANGLYYFSLRDSVGNEESFTILLDTAVSYKLTGDYVKTGEHEYIAKNDLQFTITENQAVQLFNSTPAVVNGGVITTEGNYVIRIIDAYGNDATIHICIDKTAPAIVLDGVVDGGYTKDSVTVSASGNNALYLVNRTNQILAAIENGEEFTDEGTYRIMAVDEVGNTTIVYFTINRSVPFESNVADTAITTNAVTFKFLGDLQDESVQKDGTLIDAKNKYSEAGVYNIFAVDTIGNEFYFSFTILPTRIQELKLENLTDVVITATKDKLVYAVEIVEGVLDLNEEGNYTFSFNDTKKNIEYSFSITIDNTVSVTTSIPNYSFTADKVEVSFGETVTQEVKLEGEVIKNAKQYTKAGNYEIKATDSIGNETILKFRIMPARIRELHLDNLAGVELLLTTKNDNNYAASIDANDELHITDSGHYVLFFKRATGEVFNLTCDVDNVKPTVEIEKNRGSFKTMNASKPNITATLTRDGKEISYSVGKKIEGAGHYDLTITDDLGNTNVYTFDIEEPLNWAAYASVGGLGLLGAVALIVVLIAKRRVKIR